MAMLWPAPNPQAVDREPQKDAAQEGEAERPFPGKQVARGKRLAKGTGEMQFLWTTSNENALYLEWTLSKWPRECWGIRNKGSEITRILAWATLWQEQGGHTREDSDGLGGTRENLELSLIDLIPYFWENNLEPNVPIRWFAYVAVPSSMPDNYILFSLEAVPLLRNLDISLWYLHKFFNWITVLGTGKQMLTEQNPRTPGEEIKIMVSRVSKTNRLCRTAIKCWLGPY